MKAIFIIMFIFLIGCTNQQDVVKTPEGTFRKIREQSAPNKSGAFDIELWAKDGVPTNQYVYSRSGGKFIRME